jgi:hypothetical protein
MPRVGFEPTVPVSARAKTVYALDRSAAVTGVYIFRGFYIVTQHVHSVIYNLLNLIYQYMNLFIIL